MSDDDSVSIESNPFERTVLTEERLARFRRIHEENPHPVYWGPPLEYPSSPASPPPGGGIIMTEELLAELRRIQEERTDGMYLKGRRIWPPSPKEPRQRTRHMLVGLTNPFPDHGLKRSPTGRVRSWRLEAQRKREAASSQPSNIRAKVRKRKSSGPMAPKKGRAKTRTGSRPRSPK